jgi:ADP-heptose:LPS heptosyltransferase
MQACEGLKENLPHLKLKLVAREKFAKPLDFLLRKVFDEIYYLNFKEAFAKDNDPESLTKYLKNFVSNVSSEKIDALLNLSFSNSANYLCSLIQADNRLGTYFNLNHEIVVYDPWSQYLYSNVMGGSFNSFSLVDIYKKIIGNTFPRKQTELKKHDKNKIVVHPFASLDKKHWKPSKWKEIIYKLLKNNSNLTVQIVGSPHEMKLADEIFNDPIIKPFHGQLINLTGKTSIEQLYNTIEESSHFIGHDSMVSHLAKIAQLPTLTFSLGTVRPEETIPYGEYSFAVSPKTSCFPCFPDDACSFYQCHADISYQAAYELIVSFVNHNELAPEKLKKSISDFHLSSLNIFKGRFTEDNNLFLEKINDHELDSKSTIKLFLRMAWLYRLSEAEENHRFPKLTKQTYNELFTTIKGIKYLRDLFIFGQKYSQEVLNELSEQSPNVATLQEKSEKIDEIDKLISMLKTAYPLLTPIIDYSNVIKANIPGENLVELSYGSCMAYKNSETVLSIVYELLENTLRESKFSKSAPKER